MPGDRPHTWSTLLANGCWDQGSATGSFRSRSRSKSKAKVKVKGEGQRRRRPRGRVDHDWLGLAGGVRLVLWLGGSVLPVSAQGLTDFRAGGGAFVRGWVALAAADPEICQGYARRRGERTPHPGQSTVAGLATDLSASPGMLV